MQTLRDTKEYKALTPYTATGIAEGFVEADSETEVLASWQYLHDTGMAYTLQGWFGRVASDMVEQGHIEA